MGTKRDESAKKYVAKMCEIAAKHAPDNTDSEVQRCPSCRYMTYDRGVGPVTCSHCGIIYDRCEHVRSAGDGDCVKCASPGAAFRAHRHNRGLSEARKKQSH